MQNPNYSEAWVQEELRYKKQKEAEQEEKHKAEIEKLGADFERRLERHRARDELQHFHQQAAARSNRSLRSWRLTSPTPSTTSPPSRSDLAGARLCPEDFEAQPLENGRDGRKERPTATQRDSSAQGRVTTEHKVVGNAPEPVPAAPQAVIDGPKPAAAAPDVAIDTQKPLAAAPELVTATPVHPKPTEACQPSATRQGVAVALVATEQDGDSKYIEAREDVASRGVTSKTIQQAAQNIANAHPSPLQHQFGMIPAEPILDNCAVPPVTPKPRYFPPSAGWDVDSMRGVVNTPPEQTLLVSSDMDIDPNDDPDRMDICSSPIPSRPGSPMEGVCSTTNIIIPVQGMQPQNSLDPVDVQVLRFIENNSTGPQAFEPPRDNPPSEMPPRRMAQPMNIVMSHHSGGPGTPPQNVQPHSASETHSAPMRTVRQPTNIIMTPPPVPQMGPETLQAHPANGALSLPMQVLQPPNITNTQPPAPSRLPNNGMTGSNTPGLTLTNPGTQAHVFTAGGYQSQPPPQSLGQPSPQPPAFDFGVSSNIFAGLPTSFGDRSDGFGGSFGNPAASQQCSMVTSLYPQQAMEAADRKREQKERERREYLASLPRIDGSRHSPRTSSTKNPSEKNPPEKNSSEKNSAENTEQQDIDQQLRETEDYTMGGEEQPQQMQVDEQPQEMQGGREEQPQGIEDTRAEDEQRAGAQGLSASRHAPATTPPVTPPPVAPPPMALPETRAAQQPVVG